MRLPASLSAAQRETLSELVAELAACPGVVAVALGGSHARGRANTASDVDLGVLYDERSPFAVEALRAFCARLDDTRAPVVAGFGEWGAWVDGGAWLTIRGARFDLLYRSVQRLERALDDAHAGRWQLDFAQQAPFGFFSATLCGELARCIPLHDPRGALSGLKARTAHYPDPLRSAVVQDALWQVEFGLSAFAPKLVANGDVVGAVGCMTRFAAYLMLALFALNRAWWLNDKTALAEIAEFALVPHAFAARLGAALAAPGATPAALGAALAEIDALFAETVALAGTLYAPKYPQRR
ncbi:MAG TPA: nucleotidyltransferase domain-containing protein [Myxococcota bacterium]|jgi:predicted nucleotidyltransferase